MDEAKIKQMIQDGIVSYMTQKQFSLSKIQSHGHTGTDCQRIDPKDLLGFPVISAVPTDNAINGTIRAYRSGATYRLYIRINNTWRYATLT